MRQCQSLKISLWSIIKKDQKRKENADFWMKIKKLLRATEIVWNWCWGCAHKTHTIYFPLSQSFFSYFSDQIRKRKRDILSSKISRRVIMTLPHWFYPFWIMIDFTNPYVLYIIWWAKINSTSTRNFSLALLLSLNSRKNKTRDLALVHERE